MGIFKGNIEIGSMHYGDKEIDSVYHGDTLIWEAGGEETITDGLIGYWPVHEGSGDTLYDKSGNGANGTIFGPTWADSSQGYSLHYDAVDDTVRLDAFNFPSGEKTLSLWCYIIGLDGGNAYFANVDFSGNNYIFYYNNDTELRIHNAGVTTSTTLELDTWHHIAFIYDGSNWEFWVNNSKLGTVTGGDVSGPFTHLGIYTGNHNEQRIDDVRVYNRALSSDEINTIFNKNREAILI